MEQWTGERNRWWEPTKLFFFYSLARSIHTVLTHTHTLCTHTTKSPVEMRERAESSRSPSHLVQNLPPCGTVQFVQVERRDEHVSRSSFIFRRRWPPKRREQPPPPPPPLPAPPSPPFLFHLGPHPHPSEPSLARLGNVTRSSRSSSSSATWQ